MNALTSVTYVALALHFARKVLRKGTPGKPAGTPRKNPKDNTLQQAVDKLAGRKLAIPYTLNGITFTVLSVVSKDINDTSALDKLYQNIEILMPGIFPHTKILDDGESPLGWFICSGKAVSDLPRLNTDDVEIVKNIIEYYKCEIR